MKQFEFKGAYYKALTFANDPVRRTLACGMLTKFSVLQVLEPEEKKPSFVSSRFDLIPIYGVGEVLTAPRQRADKYIFPYKWKSHLRIDEVHRHLDAPKK